ncbi:ribosome biogenesis/translation initiation ATPase RLI [Candidatus Woesearchaeota archaeon]|nr:ribosome biogenesis/translation initiation ATPase RLI [Candidatus Woesearchaeota archaeon]
MSRIAVVKKEDCNPVGCGNYLCIRVCPINRKGENCIFKGDDRKIGIDETLCIGCNICVKKCPFEAISIINLPEELKKTPIHQYGKNGFHLYNLPIPQFGKVVGLLGINGIGKSTAMQALGGLLKPNLGKEGESTYDELIQFFKGTEAQKYFEKVKNGEIVVAYKLQQVDLINRQFNGKVRDLLEKVNEKNELDKVCNALGIEMILDNDIKTISGGELQRVAIAATILKKANLYIFDEPTSYLDVKQRIIISKFIRGLANENTAVLVVEHDLIILDYMTDSVHLMYGKPGAYGIVSLPKTTKAGINAYLEGYMADANVRFRDHRIKFEKNAFKKKKEGGIILTEWIDMKKTLNNFNLTASKSILYRHEVVGVLGENGIGKTSFIKILAGEIQPDTGKIEKSVKVSYKPQYLKNDSDELVMVTLRDAIAKYDTEIIRPLNIKPLFTKQLNQLSGGELQKIAIALCLSKDAELYLMDEPSAYLDVEQRLVTARVIKDLMENKGKTAFIVDHDLLFLDFLSEKLAVFEGEPAKSGKLNAILSMENGMNMFLKNLNLTFRRDIESGRPRANKPGSIKDREQKNANKYYY